MTGSDFGGWNASDTFGYWFAGFVDGEGCFMIRRQKGRHSTAFQLNLRDDDSDLLSSIAWHLGIGNKRPYTERRGVDRYGYSHHSTARFYVQNKADCKMLVHILDRFHLRSKKANDYRIWREAVLEYYRPQPNQERLAALKVALENARKYNTGSI